MIGSLLLLRKYRIDNTFEDTVCYLPIFLYHTRVYFGNTIGHNELAGNMRRPGQKIRERRGKPSTRQGAVVISAFVHDRQRKELLQAFLTSGAYRVSQKIKKLGVRTFFGSSKPCNGLPL